MPDFGSLIMGGIAQQMGHITGGPLYYVGGHFSSVLVSVHHEMQTPLDTQWQLPSHVLYV